MKLAFSLYRAPDNKAIAVSRCERYQPRGLQSCRKKVPITKLYAELLLSLFIFHVNIGLFPAAPRDVGSGGV